MGAEVHYCGSKRDHAPHISPSMTATRYGQPDVCRGKGPKRDPEFGKYVCQVCGAVLLGEADFCEACENLGVANG